MKRSGSGLDGSNYHHEYSVQNFGIDVRNSNGIIFCTAYIDSNPQRYQDWIDFYHLKLSKFGIKLLLSNDGPVKSELDFKDCILIQTKERLGRDWDGGIFPGWKRSFGNALHFCHKKHKRIGHIESDCYLVNGGVYKYLQYLFDYTGYYSGFTPKYGFMESAIQILNDPHVVDYYLSDFSTIEGVNKCGFEESWQKKLKPEIVFVGERDENKIFSIDEKFDYISQTNLSKISKNQPLTNNPVYDFNLSDIVSINGYKTDKNDHSYLSVYEKHLSDMRKKEIILIELGVVGDETYYDPKNTLGDSVLLFRDYLNMATIHGIDFQKVNRFKNEERIVIHKADVTDDSQIKNIMACIKQADVIIDDCSHECKKTISTFIMLFPYLASGGLYIIEDLHTSYMPDYGGSRHDINDNKTIMNFIKRLLDSINSDSVPIDIRNEFSGQIKSLHMYNKIVVIEKL